MNIGDIHVALNQDFSSHILSREKGWHIVVQNNLKYSWSTHISELKLFSMISNTHTFFNWYNYYISLRM